MTLEKWATTANSEISRLTGEAKVLRALLTQALDVLHTIVPESAPEDEMLDQLTTDITHALLSKG